MNDLKVMKVLQEMYMISGDEVAVALPQFETRYRTKTGKDLRMENTNKYYQKKTDAERKIKAGSGRKAKGLENVYFNQLNSPQHPVSFVTERNLEDMCVGVMRQYVNSKGEYSVSMSVIKSILRGCEVITAKSIQTDYGYGKSQAYRILEVLKLMMTMNTDLIDEEMENYCIDNDVAIYAELLEAYDYKCDVD